LAPPSLNRTWHREAASRRLASAGLIDFKRSYGEPLKTLKNANYLLLLKVDEILVVPVNSHVGKRSPMFLYFFNCYFFFALLLLFTFLLKIGPPRPLNLDSSDVVHGEAMVFEKSPSKTHLVSRLYKGSTEILHAPVFIFSKYIERRCQELLS